jgi:hypothetical protein
MKLKLTALVLALTLVSPALFANSPVALSDQEMRVQQLERTRDKFLAAVNGLSEAQWNYKASPEKWSIAQCAEHIAASESLIRGLITKSLEAPAAEDVLKQGVNKDTPILQFMTDRSRKFTAPEPLQPTNRFGSGAEAVAEFRKERAETLKLAAADADYRKHAAQNPAFGMLDAHGWFLFLSGHSERHTLQIEEVKASEGFPKQ